MMILWAWAGVPLGVYNIVSNFNIALRIQPQILTALSLVTWIQCYYYQRRWTVSRSLAAVVPVAALMAGSQAALIVGFRILRNERHVEWPMTLMAVLSAVLLAAGVLRHYWDIWKHRTVRGISFLFVGIDAAGDVFSLASILFQTKLDVLGIVIYATEFVLWCGIFVCGGYYNLLPWIRRRILGEDLQGSSQDQETPPEQAQTVGNVAMHDLPSSTSVFRTASSEFTGMRPRTLAQVTT